MYVTNGKVEAMLKRNGANIRLQVYLDSYVLVPRTVSFVISPMQINQLPFGVHSRSIYSVAVFAKLVQGFALSGTCISENTLEDIHIMWQVCTSTIVLHNSEPGTAPLL